MHILPDGADLGDFINWELLYVGGIQLDLLKQNILIRGGISLGKIFVEDQRDLLFGPALVKSYKLESQHAIYSRIVVDRGFLDEIDQRAGTQYWRDHVRQGDDGAYFVDYLFGTVLDNYATPGTESPAALLEAHRDVIKAAISSGIKSEDERVRQKYMWLALYHNSTLMRLAERLKVLHVAFVPATFAIEQKLLKF